MKNENKHELMTGDAVGGSPSEDASVSRAPARWTMLPRQDPSLTWVYLAIIFILQLIFLAPAQAGDELIISVGQQQLISQGKPISRVAVGNAGVLHVKTIKKDTELLVTGKAPGTTDLII